MAIRMIRTMGDPILTKQCKEVKVMTPRIRELIEDMFETMYDANGVGLAAPQVTYIVQALRKEGIPIDDSLITVKEARDAILRLVGKEPVPETRTPAAPEQEDRK